MELALSKAALAFIWWKLWQPSPRDPMLHAIKHLYYRLRRASGEMLQIEEFGAKVSKAEDKRSYSLGYLTRTASTPPWKGLLLYHLVQRAAPRRLLELGTHLGFGTLYLSAAAPSAEVYTIEGSPTLAAKARQHFRLLGIKPQLLIGTFTSILPTLSGRWDFIYIDGDHRGPALYEYATYLYQRLNPGGMLVCDDVFWSREMFAGWQALNKTLNAPSKLIGPRGILYA
ncbi:MAG: class I SAM-dependent methyltransferase [Bacteroidia bacterium]|nr:class I SAM-dependent methyltransferase [Bacteroidia bacterium]